MKEPTREAPPVDLEQIRASILSQVAPPPVERTPSPCPSSTDDGTMDADDSHLVPALAQYIHVEPQSEEEIAARELKHMTAAFAAHVVSLPSEEGGKIVKWVWGPSAVAMMRYRNNAQWQAMLDDALATGECWTWGDHRPGRFSYIAYTDTRHDQCTNTQTTIASPLYQSPLIYKPPAPEAPAIKAPPTKAPPTYGPPPMGKAPPPSINTQAAIAPTPQPPPAPSINTRAGAQAIIAPTPQPPPAPVSLAQTVPDEVTPYKASPRPRAKPPPPQINDHPEWVPYAMDKFDPLHVWYSGEEDPDHIAVCEMTDREDREGGFDERNAQTFPDEFARPITDISQSAIHQPAIHPPMPITDISPGRHEPAPEPSAGDHITQPLPATPATDPSETRHPLITIDGSRPRVARDGPLHGFWYCCPDRYNVAIVFGRWFEFLELGRETRYIKKLFFDTWAKYFFDAWAAQTQRRTNKSNKILS